jgi:hypothetical protein
MKNDYSSLFDYEPELFKVYHFDKKIRLGSTRDNGYVIGLIDSEYDCYISAKISEDDSFTVGFLNKYNIDINNCYAFDGTINELPLDIKNNIQFVKKNIGPVNNEQTTNLNDILENYKNIFLKMDIEGCEWEWLNQITETHLKNISQLVIELHGITNNSWHNNFTFEYFNTTIHDKLNCLKKFSNTHYLIHAHGNNADKTSHAGIPNVIELTYINKNYFNEIPKLNENELPDRNLDFPNEKGLPDINLNFYPFVNKINKNPFLINVEDKLNYDENEYNDIQNKLSEKNIDSIIESIYTHKNKFYELDDFKNRINRGIRQQIINKPHSSPVKTLYKIGNHEDNKNCIVCCAPFKHGDNSSRYSASDKIYKSLKKSGYNGHFYLFQGGFPNPTGKEMKFAGVPYCFKIFMMLEAYKLGFTNVIWIDSGCYSINNPDDLFKLLDNQDALLKTVVGKNNYHAMSFETTIELLNRLTNTNLHDAVYIETIVFGLNMNSEKVKNLIDDYYEMVELGWPFFSIFPEEIVLSALFNKPIYKSLLLENLLDNKLYIHEKKMNEIEAKKAGYYFHHKNYINNDKNSIENNYIITFDDNKGRFGNQMFLYLTSKLFTHKFGHKYISRDQFNSDNYCIVNEENIEYFLMEKIDLKQNIVLKGFFQKSKYFVKYRKQLIDLIYQTTNNDYFLLNQEKYYIKDYLINSKHKLNLNKNDILMSLRLDDFIQYPCKTSDILPPQYYMDILNKTPLNSKLYIVCDTIKHDWEMKYIEYFKKWNPILIQENLINDIALMRDSNHLIHSNSTLSWIISFLSNKETRIIPFIPKTDKNLNQHLEKIEDKDTLIYINTLTHEEVFSLNVNSNKNIIPFSFYIPDECIVNEIPEKTRLLASIIPGDMSTYIFKNKEKEYNDMYKKSRFAITKKKGGWDCLRHYEILMNGCIPIFENLSNCPKYTLTTYPKHLNEQAYELYNNWIENDEYIEKYNKLCLQYLEHTRKNCSVSAQISYFLNNIKDGNKIKNILMITGHNGINYNRESLWIGLKRYTKEIGGIAVEYEKNPYIYEDTIHDNHFTYTKRVSSDDYIDMGKDEIVQNIEEHFWDLIIYGKVGPDEYCYFPFFDIVTKNYNKDKIAFIYGGDEIFDLTQDNNRKYYINMHGVAIYYQPYIDYLNFYKHFGKCFVRELDM